MNGVLHVMREETDSPLPPDGRSTPEGKMNKNKLKRQVLRDGEIVEYSR